MATHPFLSDAWIEEARRIHEEHRGRAAPIPHPVRMNLVVTDVPFGTGSIDAHIDTTEGELEIEVGHLPQAEVTITLEYATAKALLVEQDSQVAMQAFMGGRIKVQGDMSKMIVLQGQLDTTDPVAAEVATEIRAITD